MTLKKNEKIGVFVGVVLAFAFMIFAASLFNQSGPVSLDNINPIEDSQADDVFDNDLKVVDRVLGEGAQVTEGSVVTIHYVAALGDGTAFDSSRDDSPYTFQLGSGEVPIGLESGLVGMRVGGVRIITIPPELGYGSKQVGPIPSNSTLIFEVELLNTQEAQ